MVRYRFGGVPENEAIGGAAVTVMIFVTALLPVVLDTVRFTVYVPAVK
jgi:hypothetical protein